MLKWLMAAAAYGVLFSCVAFLAKLVFWGLSWWWLLLPLIPGALLLLILASVVLLGGKPIDLAKE